MQTAHQRTARARWLLGAACFCATASGFGAPLARAQEEARPADRPGAQDQEPAALRKPLRPGIFITPVASLRETFTDNVGLDARDRQSDLITRASLDVTAEIERGRTAARLGAGVAYDSYARHPHFSGWSFNADGAASQTLVPDRLLLEADGSLTNQYASVFRRSAVDRSGTPERTQLIVYSAGPRLTTRVTDVLDLTARARIGQTLYSHSDKSLVSQLPSDATFGQAIVRLDTGEHLRRIQLVTSTDFTRDDQGFQSLALAQSAYLRVTPKVRLIGRAGYDSIRQRGVANIHAPILSAGLEYQPNLDSRLSLEAGSRYDRTAFAAAIDYRLGQRVIVRGRYTQSVTPDQIYVANAFEQFAATSADLPRPTPGRRFNLQENLYDQTSYNKRAELNAYYSDPGQSLDLSAVWSDRRFLSSSAHDRGASGAATYVRHARPDLDLLASAAFTRTFRSPVYGASRTYDLEAGVAYYANSKTSLRAAYHYKNGRQLFTGGERLTENAIQVALQRRF